MTDAGSRRPRRVLSALCVAALLMTAGCGGFLGGDGGPGTTTAPPGGDGGDGEPGTTVDGETEPPYSDDRLPPGVSTDGSVDIAQLTEAHADALDGAAFTLDLNLTRELRNNGSTTRIVAVQEARTDGTEYVSAFSQRGQFTLAQTTWGNDSVAVSRVNASGQVRYQRARASVVQGNLSGQQFAQQFLGVANYSVAVAGEDRVVLTADSAAPGLAQQLGPSVTEVTSYEGRAVVDREGRIRELEATIGVELQQGEGDVSLTMELSDLGATSVQRPDWVGEALAETASGRLVTPDRTGAT